MTRLLTMSSAIALAAAAPAIAQQADPMASPATPSAPSATQSQTTPSPAPVPPTDEPTTTQPAPSEMDTGPVPSTDAAPAPSVDTAAPAAASADTRTATVTQLVETEFPSYDGDKDGNLNKAEFTKWVMALHSKAEEAQAATKMDEAAKATWAKNAFATADTDKSKKVSKTEMGKFLLG